MEFFRACALKNLEGARHLFSIIEASGTGLKLSFYLCQLAQVEAATGHHDAALEHVRAALKNDQEVGEPHYQPAILRLEGSILLERDPTAAGAAEERFRRPWR